MGFYMSHAVHGLQERRIDLHARGGIAVLRLGKLRPVLLCWNGIPLNSSTKTVLPCERQLHKRRVSLPRAGTSSLIWFANSCADINTELSPRWTRKSTF